MDMYIATQWARLADRSSVTKNSDTRPQLPVATVGGDGGTVPNANTLISAAVFILAAYISWTCNGRCYAGMPVFERAIRALVAGTFGFVYLVLYFIIWYPQCHYGCARKS